MNRRGFFKGLAGGLTVMALSRHLGSVTSWPAGWTPQQSDLVLSLEEYAEIYIKPGMEQLAARIDRDILG